jgi:hypothetical protein
MFDCDIFLASNLFLCLPFLSLFKLSDTILCGNDFRLKSKMLKCPHLKLSHIKWTFSKIFQLKLTPDPFLSNSQNLNL